MNFKIHLRRTCTRLGVAAAVALCGSVRFAAAQCAPAPASPSAPALDFEFYKARVEPVFLKKRGDLARCFACHEDRKIRRREGIRLRLQPLSHGSTTWTEEQSRRNFQNVSQLVVPGEPMQSCLLLYTLAPEAGGKTGKGGDSGYWWHHGGTYATQNDPDWKSMAEWVRGKNATGSSGP